MRTIIEFDDDLASRLDAWAKAQRLSRAEAVRRAVAQLLERAAPKPGSGFGLWAQGKAVPPERDGLALQQAMRDEWPT